MTDESDRIEYTKKPSPLKFYTRDQVTKSYTKHSKVKTRCYLYITCGIMDRVINALHTSEEVLGKDDYIPIFIQRLTNWKDSRVIKMIFKIRFSH